MATSITPDSRAVELVRDADFRWVPACSNHNCLCTHAVTSMGSLRPTKVTKKEEK